MIYDRGIQSQKGKKDVNINNFQNYFMWCVFFILIVGFINICIYKREGKELYQYSMW